MTKELIERAAKAVSDDVNIRHCLGNVSWQDKGDAVQDEYRAVACAALESSGHDSVLAMAEKARLELMRVGYVGGIIDELDAAIAAAQPGKTEV